ncbi:MAG: AbrB/MazE/SpoVT family DNA-binding domain-containing protein [Burkholderiales bacterium]
MSTVIVSAKGQMVIPKQLRKQLGIMSGTKLEVVAEGGGFRALVEPRRKTRTAAECLGIIGYKGPPIPIEKMSGVEAARQLARRGKLKR